MKQQRILAMVMALSAVLLTGCVAGDDYDLTGNERSEGDGQVRFGAYLHRTTSRAGYEGELNTGVLQTEGFGVIAFYTDDMQYDQLSVPNFMYNQKVTFNTTGSVWDYAPVKYWPNESGTDKLTFFAYAPWIEVSTLTGHAVDGLAEGIAALTRPNHVGDPMVSYYASLDPARRVDLCWAIPQRDRQRPTATDYKVPLTFYHALASLNVQVKAEAINDTPYSTHIYVRSVTFEGLARKGMLNLNSTNTSAPQWFDLSGKGDPGVENVTVYDGRLDGKEGRAASGNEVPASLNTKVVQGADATAGVTVTPCNLFSSVTATEPVYVIPTGEPLRVTIVYDVETADAKLVGQYLSDGTTNGSSVENRITAYVMTTGDSPEQITLEAGKKYTVTLNLGLRTVDVTASVTPWADGTSGEADLPGDSSGTAPIPVEGSSSPIIDWTNGGTESGSITFKPAP